MVFQWTTRCLVCPYLQHFFNTSGREQCRCRPLSLVYVGCLLHAATCEICIHMSLFNGHAKLEHYCCCLHVVLICFPDKRLPQIHKPGRSHHFKSQVWRHLLISTTHTHRNKHGIRSRKAHAHSAKLQARQRQSRPCCE